MTQELKIVCVPPNMFGAAWLKLGDLVPDAVRVAGDLGDIVARIEDATLQLWIAADGKPLAAWFTDINIEEDGSRWIGVYGLNGSGVRRWARALSDQMVEFARAEQCARVMFAGRKAWGRLVPGCRPVREEGGHMIWERPAQ